jgi:leader peptidase (prepilin peptidase)/N-methyltransferase
LPAELDPVYIAFAAVVGLLVGSFLNVCIYRIPRDLSVVHPRSFCTACNQQIRAVDNIPILSYLLLKGKCRCCGASIAVRYPVVELATGLLFTGIALRYPEMTSALKWCIFESILTVLFWTDLEERILPDELTLGGTLLGLLLSVAITVPGDFIPALLPDLRPPWQSFVNSATGAAFFSGMMWLLSVIYATLRKKQGLGLGDIKLLALLGAFLGIEGALQGLLIGSVSGVLLGIVYVLWTGKDLRSYELPFGSFLCAGAGIVPFLPWFAKQ